MTLGAAGLVVTVLAALGVSQLTGGPVTLLGGDESPGPTTTAAAPSPGGASPAGPGDGPTLGGDLPESLPEICPAFPEFPDETCTGYLHTGVELRDCPNVIVEDGITLDGCRFGPDLEVQASGVTITRSLIEGTVYATYLTDWSLGGLTLIDVEIDGGQRIAEGRTAAIGNNDYTCIRCHIHGSGRGANLENNVHIEDSYLHGWYYTEDAHQTAIGSNGGGNFTILHNTVECESVGDACSSALSLYSDFEPIHDVLIQNNLLQTNGGYCTYGGSDDGTNVRYIDNIFGDKFHPQCGIWGPVAAFYLSNDGNEWRGNEFPDGSAVEPNEDI